jgi:riboflavin synthase
MFTGIVEATGVVGSVDRRGDVLVLDLACDMGHLGLAPGGSIAVNGCCLTAVGVRPDGFRCELTPETVRRTAFGDRLRPGARVNLERPMRADGRFDGHIVQGHVDGVGRVLEVSTLGDSSEMSIGVPEDIERYLAQKGSVAVDGVSLTVAGLRRGAFTVALIPYTLEHTTLGRLVAGDPVNLETDIIAKHVERLLALQLHS